MALKLLFSIAICFIFTFIFNILIISLSEHIEDNVSNIYIVGIESSGTRYISRGVFNLFNNITRWDGEYPPCKHIRHDLMIQHVSIPFGNVCNGNIHVLQNIDLCTHIPKERFFLNVSNQLRLNKRDKAIIIVRDEYFTKRSISKKHCFNKHYLELEFNQAKGIIKQTMNMFDDTRQLLVISYETMAQYPTREWKRILKFLRVERDHNYIEFKNANIIKNLK